MAAFIVLVFVGLACLLLTIGFIFSERPFMFALKGLAAVGAILFLLLVLFIVIVIAKAR